MPSHPPIFGVPNASPDFRQRANPSETKSQHLNHIDLQDESTSLHNLRSNMGTGHGHSLDKHTITSLREILSETLPQTHQNKPATKPQVLAEGSLSPSPPSPPPPSPVAKEAQLVASTSLKSPRSPIQLLHDQNMENDMEWASEGMSLGSHA
ncbi:MAG: hypothetical protein Q9220_006161 [cf. Caloplaca sp. 1 TL-2023]